jgi:hypothetical protein
MRGSKQSYFFDSGSMLLQCICNFESDATFSIGASNMYHQSIGLEELIDKVIERRKDRKKHGNRNWVSMALS